MKLTTLDLVIMLLPLVLTTAFTVYLRRYMRGVAGFLAAGRGAGRFLLATATGEATAGVMGTVSMMEVFSRAGFSMQFWGAFTGLIWLFITISGFVTFRMRETRVYTLNQFLEQRYSKGLRIFASVLSFTSGLFFFGVVPGVTARFFVYFLGLPAEIALFSMEVPTIFVVMVAMTALAITSTMVSGQVGVIISDSLEYVISGALYLVVITAILGVFTLPLVRLDQVEQALLSGSAGSSYVNPLDIAARQDFNGWFIVIGFMLALYYFRGNGSASAATAHESRMAAVLGTWRGFGVVALTSLVAVGAFTILRHPDFAQQQASVAASLSHIDNAQLRTQMQMPSALGHLLPTGVRGCFVAIGLLRSIAGMGAYCMFLGSTFIQDVLLPIRNKPIEPDRQVRWLRLAVFGAGAFTVGFSMIYRPSDYLQLLMALIGSISLGGAGVVFFGGLYWKRGTTKAAWAALITGAGCALIGWGLQTFWKELQPLCAAHAPWEGVRDWAAANAGRFPVNGQIMSLIAAGLASSVYIITSILTCREPHNMDKLLHRGAYAVKEDLDGTESKAAAILDKRGWLARFLQVDEHYTKWDKIFAYSVFFYSTFWSVMFVVALIWNLGFQRWPDVWWWRYILIQNIIVPLIICVVNIFWFGIGACRDVVRLIRKLESAVPDPEDDGQVLANRHPEAGAKAAEADAKKEAASQP